MYRHGRFALLLVVIGYSIAFANAQSAGSQPGSLIAEIVIPEANGAFGKAIGYDGLFLYYAEWAGNILHRIDVPPPGLSQASGHIDIPIQGAASGIMTISYDSRRDAFWAIGGDGLSIYFLDKTGHATLVSMIKPADRPGDCKPRGMLWMDGCSTEVKINYDAVDDTIWYAPDTSKRIYHYYTFPDAFGTAQLVTAMPFVDVDVAPNDMSAECGYSQVSGVATGGSSLFINVGGCSFFFEFTKTGTKVGSYPVALRPTGDIECDNRSYNVSVIWARDGWNGRIYAFQQSRPDACVFGGGTWSR